MLGEHIYSKIISENFKAATHARKTKKAVLVCLAIAFSNQHLYGGIAWKICLVTDRLKAEVWTTNTRNLLRISIKERKTSIVHRSFLGFLKKSATDNYLVGTDKCNTRAHSRTESWRANDLPIVLLLFQVESFHGVKNAILSIIETAKDVEIVTTYRAPMKFPRLLHGHDPIELLCGQVKT